MVPTFLAFYRCIESLRRLSRPCPRHQRLPVLRSGKGRDDVAFMHFKTTCPDPISKNVMSCCRHAAIVNDPISRNSPLLLCLSHPAQHDHRKEYRYNMANPRQRRKARSGGRGAKPTKPALRRLHNKQNKAVQMKGPKALQDSWDKNKTVLQK